MQYKGKGRIVTGEPVMDQAPTGKEAKLLKLVSESLFVQAYPHPWVASLSLFSACHSIHVPTGPIFHREEERGP